MATVIDKDERIAELESQVAALEERLHSQGLINKAKGWIMERLKMSEPEAYRTIQKLASKTNQRLHESAACINLLIECVERVEGYRVDRS